MAFVCLLLAAFLALGMNNFQKERVWSGLGSFFLLFDHAHQSIK
jgi:hypothetical protein